MAVGRRQPSSTVPYTAVAVFFALFLIAAVVAIIFYSNSEKYRKMSLALTEQKNELATDQQWEKRGTIIGNKKIDETYTGTMIEYLDKMVSEIIGTPLDDTSAEMKVDKAVSEIQKATSSLKDSNSIGDVIPKSAGLVQILNQVKTKLNQFKQSVETAEKQLADLHDKFNQAMQASRDKEQNLLAAKENLQKMVDKIKADYNDLSELLKQTTDEKVQSLMKQLETERAENENQNEQLLRLNAELKVAQNRLEKLQSEMPSPDSEVAVYEPDGKIILVDSQAKTVQLDIGSENKVFPGLTFSVYDKGVPIPREGKGKAEIEVFSVSENFSAARITEAPTKENPIILDDVVANLVWDSQRTNTFMVAGEFDLNNDGTIEQDGAEKIQSLIKRWGGEITNEVTSNLDFLILGKPSTVLSRPSLQEMEADPLAMEKYEASRQKLENYLKVQQQAKDLSIPIMNAERFMYFIGYKSQVKRAGAF